MALSAQQFEDIVMGRVQRTQGVAGETIEGIVSLQGLAGSPETIHVSDWSDCKFDSSVRIESCACDTDLDLRGAKVNGSLTIANFSFPGTGGLLASGLQCVGSLELREIEGSQATTSVAISKDAGADEVRPFQGLNLNGIRIGGNLIVLRCDVRYTGALCLDFAEVSGYAKIEHAVSGNSWLTGSFAVVKGLFMVTILGSPDGSERARGESVCSIKHSGHLLFDGISTGSSFSLTLDNCAIERVRLIRAAAGKSIKVIGTGEVTLDSVELNGSTAGNGIFVQGIRVDNTFDCSNCATDGKMQLQDITAGRISLSEVRTGEIRLNRLDVSGQLDCFGSIAAGDVLVGWDEPGGEARISASEVDFYQAKARSITLEGVRINSKPDPDEPDGCVKRTGELDLSRTTVGSLLHLKNLTADRELRVSYSGVGAVQFRDVTSAKLVARGIVVERYLEMVAVKFESAILDDATINEDLRVFDKESIESANWLITDSAKKLAGNFPRQSIKDTVENLVDRGIVSRFGRIAVRNGKIGSMNLEHAFFSGDPRPDPDSVAKDSLTYIDCQNITVLGQFKVRQTQFPVSPVGAYEAKALWGSSSLLDIRGSRIGEMDLGDPLPGIINLRGAFVESWGLNDDDPEKYDEILGENSFELDIGSYLRIENQLENAGHRKKADRLHVLWRDRESAKFRGFQAFGARMHRATIRYGTDKWHILRIWLLCVALGTVLLSFDYRDDVQISTTFLADRKECGALCEARPVPSLSEDALFTVLDSLQMVVRNGIPIIDTGLVPHLEARLHTSGWWWLILMRFAGWIAWPLFLASAVASFFPKRHRA